MIGRVGDINIARPIDCYPIRISQLSGADPLGSQGAEKGTRSRQLLDETIVSVGNQNISTSVNSNSSGRIKLPFASSLSAFKHVHWTFRLGTELRSRRECAHALLKVWNILSGDVQHVERSCFSPEGK